MSPPIVSFVDPGAAYFRFEYDDDKRATNLERHGIDLRDAAKAFIGATVTELDTRFDYGEDRLVTLGIVDGVVLYVAHTESGDGIVRLISARRALPHEQKIYFSKTRTSL